MRKHLCQIFTLMFFISISSLRAATSDSLAVTSTESPTFFSEFTKQSITWNWLNRFRMSNSSAKYWQWQVNDYFRSNLIAPGQKTEQWKDEHILSGRFLYKNSLISPGMYIKSWLQSDKQDSTQNRFSNHAIGIYLKSKYLQPYMGYQQSKSRTRTEWGWDVGLIGSRNYKFDIYSANVDLESNYDFYENRKNLENTLNTSVKTTFNRFSGDSLSFTFSEVSKQYYASGKLEQVKIYNRNWHNNLYYYLSLRDLITLQTQIQSRDISYFNGRKIFYLQNKLQYFHNGQRLFLGLHLRTNDETQDNSGIRTDSRTRQTAMRVELGYQINANQRFSGDFAYAKLQYDTPDEKSNHDDRDEQRYIFNLNYHYSFSPVLQLEISTYAYLFHQMYIFSEQSINNSWNRIYKLNPKVDYDYGRIHNRLSTEVLANYTVYDFEHLIRQTRSYVFRKYTFADSLIVRIFGSHHAGLYVKLELEDKGSFFDKEFTQQILQSHKSEFYNFFLLNEKIFYFRLKAGYTVYRRQERRYIPKKVRSRIITNQGPYVNLSYKTSQKIMFSANAALSHLDDSAYKKTRYSTGYIRLHYLL